MVGIIVWLVVGGLAGWLASIVMRTDGQQGLLLNIIVGIVGAVIANLIFGVGINQAITVMTFIYSVIGAIILLAILNLINRGRVR
ncbi:MAG: GlsB/YeaQ/YmgE family stress response membrane protein [Sphingomonas sp.]|uniref:GlsB/YeaQ/YmgE family stress response membrane protein n=1 Tax=Sphingomonas sp. TaxID=28214 RepID=UPI001ACFDBF1|nr:GlsB/YeaQ/YmgE family stress response membrane protein [Sphingomonas sp.]MBN8817020.1 GlsB/YeaQ/YmgE family stress response membrane protein [Sphingomonas sp.]